MWDFDPVDRDWYNHDQREEIRVTEAEAEAEENAQAVRDAKSGSELLPNQLPYAYIRTVYDVAAELSAGSSEDADLVGNALFIETADWDVSVLRSAFDVLIATRRDVVEAVARYAYRLTLGAG